MPPLSFFEQRHKFLAQEIDGVEFLMEVDLLNLSLLYLSEFRGRQDHQKRCAARGKTPFSGLGSETLLARRTLPGLGWQFCSPFTQHMPE